MTQNPFQAMLQLARMGQDPMGYVRSVARQDPRMGQFLRMVEGKSPQQLRQMAENMARERGLTAQDISRQLGIPFNGGM